MNTSQVFSYFEAFSGKSAKDNIIFIEGAELKIKSFVKSEEYLQLPQISGLIASVANEMLVMSKKSQEKDYVSKNGNLLTTGTSSDEIQSANQLVCYFKKMCAEYINDTDFFFKGA